MKQREIKFRAWDNLEKKMYEDVCPVNYDRKAFPKMLIWGNGMNYLGTYGNQITMETFIQIGDFEIMQFTGLLDKEGKEIYEGDVLELKAPGVGFIYEVRFELGKFVCYHVGKNESIGRWGDLRRWGDLHRAFDPDFSEFTFVVIGDVFTTPELLKN